MTDDPALPQLLRRAGLPDDLGEPDALLAGIEAAPAARKADAWLELIGQDLPDALVAALGARRAALWRTAAAPPDRAQRLAGLRRVLRERGVDGFVLMRTDEHGSEYLPGYAERV